MAPSRCLFFVNLLLFCLLFQQNILNSSAAECLKPRFNPNRIITINYFFTATDQSWPDIDICEIVNKSNGLINIRYRMISDMKDKNNCKKIENCMENRRFACNYKFYQANYDDCNKSLPRMEVEVGDCACDGTADNILTENYAELTGYGVQNTPTLVVNRRYDPCLTDYSFSGLKTYFCEAYNNKLPFC